MPVQPVGTVWERCRPEKQSGLSLQVTWGLHVWEATHLRGSERELFSQTRRKSAVGGFSRAQIVSRHQTFPPIFWLGAGILPRRGDFNARHSLIVRLYFYQTPIFCVSAYILYTRLNFHETLEFWAFARIFMRRRNFEHLPEFSCDANILCIC